MSRHITLHCDMCGRMIERAAAKLHLTPVKEGAAIQAPMSAYTHSGDICEECKSKLEVKLKPRQRRKAKAA
jgi:DNA-directed RNA polymerase subunit RPC12/RpoP